MADGVHQMRLAETRGAVEEQRAEARHAGFGQRLGRVERHAIRRRDHEPVESIARIERRPLGGRTLRHGGHRRGSGGHQRQRRFGRGRIEQRRRRNDSGGQGSCGFDYDVTDLRKLGAEFMRQALGIMVADPIGHEGGRQRQANDAVAVGRDQFHRFQPSVEQALSGGHAQALAHAGPCRCHLHLFMIHRHRHLNIPLPRREAGFPALSVRRLKIPPRPRRSVGRTRRFARAPDRRKGVGECCLGTEMPVDQVTKPK